MLCITLRKIYLKQITQQAIIRFGIAKYRDTGLDKKKYKAKLSVSRDWNINSNNRQLCLTVNYRDVLFC